MTLNETLASIMLPSGIDIGGADVSVLFGYYRPSTLSPSTLQENSNFTVASSIVTATVLGQNVNNLYDDIIINVTLYSEV